MPEQPKCACAVPEGLAVHGQLKHMMYNVLEIAPQAGTHACGQLYQSIDQHAQQQHGQTQIHQCPQQRHPGQARFRNTVAHDRLNRVARQYFFPHAGMVTKTRCSP